MSRWTLALICGGHGSVSGIAVNHRPGRSRWPLGTHVTRCSLVALRPSGSGLSRQPRNSRRSDGSLWSGCSHRTVALWGKIWNVSGKVFQSFFYHIESSMQQIKINTVWLRRRRRIKKRINQFNPVVCSQDATKDSQKQNFLKGFFETNETKQKKKEKKNIFAKSLSQKVNFQVETFNRR